MRRGLWWLALIAMSVATPARAQVSDALRDRVNQLVAKLDAEKIEARDAAQKALVELGPRIKPLLDDAEKSGSAERKARLARVREALGKAEENTNLGASKITIKQKGVRLSEAIKLLQAQSGNTINDLREQEGVDVTNPALDLEIVDKPFFEALDLVAEQAGVLPSFFTGDGSIGLMGAAMPGGAPRTTKPMVVYSGPFRVQFKQISAVRDFDTGTATSNAQFELAWEPRLRPMLLAFKPDSVQATTDEGKPVPRSVMDESDDVALRPENPAAEVNLNLVAPDRSAKELKSFKVKGEVTLPAGLKTFNFKSLEAKDDTIKEGDIAVTLESTTIEEGIWRVNVTVAYPGGGPAFESYRQGLFNNRLWLQKADGSRFEHNGGFNNTGSDDGKLSFEYLFVDAPGKLADYGLVYETPSKVVTIPLEFEFKKIPLP
ncbi:MAG TPA: hypothetical protein VGH33_19905 [Isosphaeraceae bacterium]